MSVSPKVQAYADRDLNQVAEGKLGKLSDDDLRELWRRMAKKTDTPCSDSALSLFKTKELIEGILQFKKTVKKTPVVVVESTEVKPLERIVELSPSTDLKKLENDNDVALLEDQHCLTICSWNSLELRFGDIVSKTEDDSEEAEAKRTLWRALIREFTKYDVIVMQEVPASEFKVEKKTRLISEWLTMYSEEDWQLFFSNPSGKDGKTSGARTHVHACWTRTPLEVLKQTTLTTIESTTLDYAPLQLVIKDSRFKDPADQIFVVTSVHLPPDSRSADRDAQLKRLLSGYAATDSSQYRLGMSFGPHRQSNEPPPFHVILGDYNCYPGKSTEKNNDVYGLTKNHFVAKLPEGAATSEGFGHYDNFLVDTVSDARLLSGVSILPLKRTEAKLSDHDPIVLTIVESRKAKQKEAWTSQGEP
jgi:endonuclease/exonuclease/phosphatase family metal-dependent hydrolase